MVISLKLLAFVVEIKMRTAEDENRPPHFRNTALFWSPKRSKFVQEINMATIISAEKLSLKLNGL